VTKAAPQSRAFAVKKYRLEALSDGIYAIALTLLVLELKLPALPHDVADQALRDALLELIPKVLAWLLSFSVIALLWVVQQRIYRFIETIDRGLGRVELVLLALVSLLPFSTAVVGEYGTHVSAAVLYAGHLVAISLVGVLRVVVFLRSSAVHSPELDAHAIRGMRIRAAIFAVCALATFLLAFVVPGFNMLAMLPSALAPALARD
jgi:uncharacterized membrane protein